MTNNIYHVIAYKDRVDRYEPPEALRKEKYVKTPATASRLNPGPAGREGLDANWCV